MPKFNESNSEQYQRLKIEVKEEIKQLILKLKAFDARQKQRPNDGGFGGSMGHIKEQLENINSFLG